MRIMPDDCWILQVWQLLVGRYAICAEYGMLTFLSNLISIFGINSFCY